MSSSLIKRILSSLVLAPLVLFVIWYGSWPFIIMMLAAFAVAMYEWVGMARRLSYPFLFGLLGFIYIAVSFFSFYILDEIEYSGLSLHILILVWASDTGAYVFGKVIGGKKLLPSVSPNKTWAGLLGAILGPFIAVFIYILYLGVSIHGNFNMFVDRGLPTAAALCPVVGVFVGVFGQVGDMLISFVKRKSNLKDTGNLIPGHGGILDRIDSLMLVSLMLLLLLLVLRV